MPNHVTHRVILSGSVDEVAAAKQLLITEMPAEWSSFAPDGTPLTPPPTNGIDFNRITPMPSILRHVVAPPRTGPNGRFILREEDPSVNILYRAEREATAEEMEEILATGYNDWYAWALDNWGTKWNGYGFQEVDSQAHYEFMFDTAWSPPLPILDKLATQFPNVKMELGWFDEGWCHAGLGTLNAEENAGTKVSLFRDADAQAYKFVFGSYPPSDQQLEEQEQIDVADANDLRLADNFTCYDVGSAMDANGYYQVQAELHSDDMTLDDDTLCIIRQVRDQIRLKLGI